MKVDIKELLYCFQEEFDLAALLGAANTNCAGGTVRHHTCVMGGGYGT